jgi:transcriptional regulator PpsR
MRAFTSPARWFAGIDAEATAGLIADVVDFALILDQDGRVLDSAFHSEAFAREFADQEHWLAKPWRELVTVESRQKIDELLHDGKAATRGRHVNYPAVGGRDIPVMVSLRVLGKSGYRMAVGRDLREFATLQQRVVDAQQSFERDYAGLRQVETRYRILFQMTPEPVMIVDATSQKIIEANPAARKLTGRESKMIGATLSQLVQKASLPVVEAMLAGIKASGRADDIMLGLADGPDMRASAFLFRQGNERLFLLRLVPPADAPERPRGAGTQMLKLLERVPDGFVVTDQDGMILTANEAFLDMTQLRNEVLARGMPLDRWVGRPGVDLAVLLTNLRQSGTVRLFATGLRDEFGAESEVEISAGSVVTETGQNFGFSIRVIDRRVSPEHATPRAFPKSLEQIIELIGRVALKDLVREATDVIERLSIEAALTMTGDNRASAAEILGVSRQSLYVKMRRHGLSDAEPIIVA